MVSGKSIIRLAYAVHNNATGSPHNGWCRYQK